MYLKFEVITIFLTLITTAVRNSNYVNARRSRPFTTTAFVQKTNNGNTYFAQIRGGDATVSDDVVVKKETDPTEEKSLNEKVHAAMEKLGLSSPSTGNTTEEECFKDGVCTLPEKKDEPELTTNPHEMSERLAKETNVDSRLTMAAIGATSAIRGDDQRIFNESAARQMIQQELDLIESIQIDSDYMKTLTNEGFDEFLSRRALAFAENNLEDARAILMADQLDAEVDDAEEEQKEVSAAESIVSQSTVQDTIQSNAEEKERVVADSKLTGDNMIENKLESFVEVKPPTTSTDVASTNSNENNNIPKPAKKETVVFEATTDQIQKLVLESPVPVLLDVYADWCGPCKVLGPAIEDMAIKSGGMFRVVKLNSDNERPVSQALEVTALPTVFGILDGKIVHMFQGMPKSEDMMRNFMMGLFGAAPFSPQVTNEEKEKYEELTKKLIKSASAASFSFSARERLIDRIIMKLDELVQNDSVSDVEGCARLLRTLLSNIIDNPYEEKFRKIKLGNKVIASKIGVNSSCLAILKLIGFSKSGSDMIIGNGVQVINVAPIVVGRDCVDKWIQRNRKEMAAAARKRKDEIDRARIQAEMSDVDDDNDGESEDEAEEIDPLSCKLKLRLDGKNKIHDAVLHRDDPLSKVLDELGIKWEDEEDDIHVTCVAKRMVVKSSDKVALEKTLGEHRLMPAANIVVKVGASSKVDISNLKGRAAGKKIRKTGSHTMQSIGIYSKDDNNKAELIDGGGGVWYEHDISDDEDEDQDKDVKPEGTDSEDSSKEESLEPEESEDADNGTNE